MSVITPNGLRSAVVDRPGRPQASAGTLRRTRDLAMWAAWQGGVSIVDIAHEYGRNRSTVWRRIQIVKRSGIDRGSTRRVD